MSEQEREIIAAVLAAFDRASSEKYDELRWQEFCEQCGVEPLRKLLTLTREQFEQGYADRSRRTVEWLRSNGQIALPCSCGEEGCPGWQMVCRETVLLAHDLYLSEDLKAVRDSFTCFPATESEEKTMAVLKEERRRQNRADARETLGDEWDGICLRPKDEKR